MIFLKKGKNEEISRNNWVNSTKLPGDLVCYGSELKTKAKVSLLSIKAKYQNSKLIDLLKINNKNLTSSVIVRVL